MKLNCLIAAALLLSVPPALAQQATLRDAALDAAIATFELALPRLERTEFGVDVAGFRDALTLHRFDSTFWGGSVRLDIEMRESADGSCGRFAAFVRIPPQDGVVRLVLCPQFFSPGADALRELTILHEMVHVVAGRDECQAMALAAKVQSLATGRFTPVDAYWQASGCVGTAYSLPR